MKYNKSKPKVEYELFIPLVNFILFDRFESPDFNSDSEILSDNYIESLGTIDVSKLEENFFTHRVYSYLKELTDNSRSGLFEIIYNNDTYVDVCNWADSQRLKKGFVWTLNSDGTDYLTVADTNSLSFGDGTNDSPFTMSVWVEVVAGTAAQMVIAKGTGGIASTSTMEWQFQIASTEKLYFVLFDSVNGGYRGRYHDTVISGWHHICVTYSGVGGTNANTGITLYLDGIAVTPAEYTNGSYTAMNNTAQAIGVLAYNAGSNPVKGDLGVICIDAIEWSSTKVRDFYESTRDLYNL
jgi:hypothetical protein